MKILKYLLYTILGLIVVFLALGMIYPTVDYGYEITVDKPAKEAWAVSMDESKLSQWLKGYKSTELLSGEQGKEGSTYKITVEPSPGEDDFEMIETLVEIQEYERAVMKFDSDMGRFDQVYTFEEKDGKTTMTSSAKITGNGIMTKSMFALMSMFGSFKAQEAENMDALKKVIEENKTDYFPVVEEVIEEGSDSEETAAGTLEDEGK